MKSIKFVITIILYLIPYLSFIESAKILGVFPYPAKSHSILIEVIMKELVKRGNEVTVITNFPLLDKLTNYTEVIIEPSYDIWKDVRGESLFELSTMSFKKMINLLYEIGYSTTEHAFKDKRVQEFINGNDDKPFDLIIVEQYYQEAFLMFGHKYNAPIIAISTFGFGQYMSTMNGGFTPWSHVPHEFLPYDDNMEFNERLSNVMSCLYDLYIRNNDYLPKQEKLAKEYFSSLPGTLPSINELEKNISLILVNSHLALTTPRPNLPAVIQIGGAHIGNIKPLPRDVRQFLDDAIYGAIYFNLGTNLKSSDLPKETLAIFLKVFGGMRQKILWKWEHKKIPDLPKNIMVKKWMPQSDILAHPHVRLFITHGGLLSVQEGVFRSVPMLGIPIFLGQHLNMYKAEKDGYAITLDFKNITEQSLQWAINELFFNQIYSERISKISRIFRDRPVRALDETIYWIDYVIRYKGAEHLKSSALNLTFFNYFLLDIVCLIFFIIFLIFIVIFVLIKFIKMKRRQGLKKFN